MGSYIKERREAIGFSQRQLGESVGSSKEYISQIESGRIKLPNPGLRRRLAEALGVRHVDLLIAAGELSPDEIPAEGAPREPFPPGDPRREVLALLETTPIERHRVPGLLLGIRISAEKE